MTVQVTRTLVLLSVARAFAPARRVAPFASRLGSTLAEPERATSACTYPGKVLSVASAGPLSLLTVSITNISGSDLVGRACGAGVVVAARPPLAFALCPSSCAADDVVSLEPAAAHADGDGACRAIPGVGDIALIDRPLLTASARSTCSRRRRAEFLLVHDGRRRRGSDRSIAAGARRGDARLHMRTRRRGGADAVAFGAGDIVAFAPPALERWTVAITVAAAAGSRAQAVSWAEDRARNGDDALAIAHDVGVLRQLFTHTTAAVRDAFSA